MIKFRRKLTSAKVIALGYIIVILLGSFFLSLPIASVSHKWTPYVDALFTSASATCVTGLTVYATVSHWSLYGQIVILLLIQIGGIGFMAVISMFSMFLKRKIGLYERKILMDTEGTGRISGVMLMLKKILLYTLFFEVFGAVLLSVRFIGDYGWARGIYYGIFHSVSAFCNAGFDLLGGASLIGYAGDPLVCITLMVLICVGGLGFIVWGDIFDNRFRFKKYMLHTKIVIIATVTLVFGAAVIYFFAEANASMAGQSVWNRILSSLFLAVTPRTAGFANVNINELSNGGALLTMALMFVGGNTGSTAGGVKITTVLVVIFGVIAAVKKDNDAVINKKRVEVAVVLQAFSIILCYIALVFTATLVISFCEPSCKLKEILFETISAIATVGLSYGITGGLTVFSKLVLVFLMFIGRVGVFTSLMAVAARKQKPPVKRPDGKILIG